MTRLTSLVIRYSADIMGPFVGNTEKDIFLPKRHNLRQIMGKCLTELIKNKCCMLQQCQKNDEREGKTEKLLQIGQNTEK